METSSMNKCPNGLTPMLEINADILGLITSMPLTLPLNTPGKKFNSKCTPPSTKVPMMNLGDSPT